MKSPHSGRNRGETNLNLVFVLASTAIAVLLVVLSFMFENGAGPRPWLIEWTNWAAKYVALVLAAHSIFKLVDATATWLRK